MKGGGLGSSPLKMGKMKSEMSQAGKPPKPKGETSFIIEEMMDHGIAKGDITMSDGTGTDNMTCVIVQFLDPNATSGPGMEPSSPSDLKEEQKTTS